MALDCMQANPDTHYVILVEDNGTNGYRRDDDYTWQGIIKTVEEDGIRYDIGYRVFEIMEHERSLWVANIGGRPWIPITAGDTISNFSNAREYANLLHPKVQIMSGRSSDHENNSRFCYAIAHPRHRVKGLELCIDYLLLIPRDKDILPQIGRI